MTCRGKAIVGIVAAVLLLSGSLAAWSTAIVRDGDPYTIGAALAQQDGSTVTLTCEHVLWQGKSGKSFAIKEWFEPSPQQPRLLVVSTRPLPVENWWSVDVTGTISTFQRTLADGASIEQRVLIVNPSDVLVYCDLRGRPVHCAAFKGFNIGSIARRSLAEFGTQTLLSSAGFPTIPDKPDPLPPLPGSRNSIKCLPDSARVSINGAVVSASFGNRFCIERSDRSFATWVQYSQPVPVGTLVDISGAMSTEAGMRLVTADTVTTLDTGYTISSYLGMNNRDVWHSLDNIGIDTSGFRVKVWGNVTSVDSTNRVFYITDGSPTSGLRIKDYSTDALPSPDTFVIVSGMSAIDTTAPGVRTIYRFSIDPGTVTCQLSSIQASSGTGTISGTITATGADGTSVRVYCGKASTTATFSGGAAQYTLKVPCGTYAVTASAIGYKTITKRVVVNNSTQQPVHDITMPTLGKRIDIISTPAGTLSDGTKETVVTAIVRDEEGRRIPNAYVRWNLTSATIYSADSTTDVVGEAKAIVRHSTATNAAVEVGTSVVSSQKAIN